MNQNNYEIIIACIQHGAPALATPLIQSLNIITEKANRLTELEKQSAEAAKQAEVAKNEKVASVSQAGQPTKK